MMYYLLTLVIVLFTSIAHILLKAATCRAVKSHAVLYTHPLSLLSYGIFAIVAFLSIIAMKGLDLKVFFALNSLTYIVIPLLAYLLLKESFTRNKVIGIILISVGVVLFNI